MDAKLLRTRIVPKLLAFDGNIGPSFVIAIGGDLAVKGKVSEWRVIACKRLWNWRKLSNYKMYLGDRMLWCRATVGRVGAAVALFAGSTTMPGGLGAKFGFPWLITGFGDDDRLCCWWCWWWLTKEGDCGGCGEDGAVEDANNVDLLGKIGAGGGIGTPLLLLFGITIDGVAVACAFSFGETEAAAIGLKKRF